ncbi:MAG: hypothetical protein MI784_08665 [Cytophagales bacterium]|nr:hypothetical protein [Cytophagales bacterium]
MKKLIPSFIALCVFISCQKTPRINGFDSQKWRTDKNACLGYRISHYRLLIEQRDQLKGLSTTQIHKLLGLPNKNQLYDRDQKYYYYSTSPNKKCGSHYAKTPETYLRLRFNSIGYVNELTITNE